ncbi:MAG: DNA alkylation repair protein [Saprospiraceae bacterium]|nr:DNA alkylation repair protein [Saprospiraceae bacterium]
MLKPADYYTLVRETFRTHGNPVTAQGQMAYMRNQFEFFGLKMPQWMALTKVIHGQYGIPEGEDLKNLVRLCFEDEHREMHYFGLETLQKALKKQPSECIEFLEELMLARSWWDTVDWINKLAGLHFQRFPELIKPVTERWMASGNFWLQRVCLIFQLTYKEKTDAALLFDYVERLAGSKEFFLQKGAGWALRQYAKTDPEAVVAFVEKTRLAPLTKREALKHVGLSSDRPSRF